MSQLIKNIAKFLIILGSIYNLGINILTFILIKIKNNTTGRNKVEYIYY